jgi:precorrin-6B methylase 2
MNEKINSNLYRSEILTHWERFKKLPGSEAIASKAALLAIIALTLVRPPRKVLEIGAGLGTITHLILEFTPAELISTEPVEILNQDLKRQESQFLRVVTDESEIDFKDFSPDWVIIDGPCNMQSLKKLLAPGVLEVVVVENQRIMSRFKVATTLYKLGIRFNYSELDSSDQTGIATFLTISERVAKQNRVGMTLDMLAFFSRLGPRFLKQILYSKGKSLRIGSNLEDASGV